VNTTEALPANIREFSEVTAVIFAQLYVSFPIPRLIDIQEVAATLGLNPLTEMPSGRGFNDIFSHTLSWLIRENYIQALASVPRDRCVLTTRALMAMNVVPPTLNQTLGSELAEAAKQAPSQAGKNRMVDLIADFIGNVLGSAAKSMME